MIKKEAKGNKDYKNLDMEAVQGIKIHTLKIEKREEPNHLKILNKEKNIITFKTKSTGLSPEKTNREFSPIKSPIE